jgi:hypothetical protein
MFLGKERMMDNVQNIIFVLMYHRHKLLYLIRFCCLYFFLPLFPHLYFSSSKKMLARHDKRSHNTESYRRLSPGSVRVSIKEWYDLVYQLKRIW